MSCDTEDFFLGKRQTEPICGFWFACLVSLKILSSLERRQLTAFGAYTYDMENRALNKAGDHVEGLLRFLAVKPLPIQPPFRSNPIKRGPSQLTGVHGCSATARHFEGFRLFT